MDFAVISLQLNSSQYASAPFCYSSVFIFEVADKIDAILLVVVLYFKVVNS